MTPPPWAIIWRPAHLQPKKTPFRLMPTTVFQPFAEMSSGLARKEAPALLTMMSRRPKSLTVRSTSSFTASSWRTSMASAREWRPSFLISAATGSRFSILRLATTTSAPARANSIAMERPMPTPPPVTMATLFSIENGDAAMMPPAGLLRSRERAGVKVSREATGDDAIIPSRAGGALSKCMRAPLLGWTKPRRLACRQRRPWRPERVPCSGVPDDGMTQIRQLHADLVPAASAEARARALSGRVAAPARDSG